MSYLITVLVTILVNLSTNKILEKRLKENGYLEKIVRTKKLSIANLISILCIIVPYLNLGMSALTIFMTLKALKDDDCLLEMFKSRCYSSHTVKRIYENDNVEEQTLRDAMTLDGAEEETINQELQKVREQKKGIEEADYSLRFYKPTPYFTEEEYRWAWIEEKARALLEEVSLDTELSASEEEKLLNVFRKEYQDELSSKEKKSEVVMKKVLKITNKK